MLLYSRQIWINSMQSIVIGCEIINDFNGENIHCFQGSTWLYTACKWLYTDSVQRLRLFAVGFMNLFQVTDPCWKVIVYVSSIVVEYYYENYYNIICTVTLTLLTLPNRSACLRSTFSRSCAEHPSFLFLFLFLSFHFCVQGRYIFIMTTIHKAIMAYAWRI